MAYKEVFILPEQTEEIGAKIKKVRVRYSQRCAYIVKYLCDSIYIYMHYEYMCVYIYILECHKIFSTEIPSSQYREENKISCSFHGP